jgi:hypothetical protein
VFGREQGWADLHSPTATRSTSCDAPIRPPSRDRPAGSQLVHDDRLISAALIAEVDRLYHQGATTIGMAETARSYRRRIPWPTWNSSGKEWQAGDVAPAVLIAVEW